MNARDRILIDALHGGFPVTDRPYAAVAEQLDMAESEVIERISGLLEDGLLTRFGPLYDATKLGGAFSLAAISVPEGRFEEVAAIVNGFPEVAHNYEREHALNMWFVVATESPEAIGAVLAEIEARTGLALLNMPKEKEYFLELRLPA